MSLKIEQIADEIIETDFLVLGGGLVGCMAALRARKKKDLDVAIVERGTIRWGGNAIGFDDWNIEHPGIIEHPIPKDFSAMQAEKGVFGAKRFFNLVSSKLAVAEAKNYVKPLVVLEGLGVNIREDDGTVKVKQTQKIPGGPNWHRLVPDENGKIEGDKVFYRGADVKEKLAIAVERSGARIFNRTIMTSVITKDGTAVGATCLNTRTGKFIVFKAKTVLISTGDSRRLYTYPYAPYPNNLFLNTHFAANHGGGIAAAYRVGAKLANMEYLQVYTVASGVCTTSSSGASMYWTMKNSKGECLEEKYKDRMLHKFGGHFPGTNFLYAPNMDAPEIERDVITYDTSEATEDEIASCYFTCATEYPRMLKLHKLAGGIRKGPVEVRSFIPGLLSGIVGILMTSEKAETSVKNLFVAGSSASSTGSSGSKAMVWGLIAGDHMRAVTPEIKSPVFGQEQLKHIEGERKRVLSPLGSTGIVDPLELEDYVRKINMNYINIRKTESKLRRAIELFNMAREKAVPHLTADNPHNLVHALEVQDIIDISEIHARASLLRTESRMVPGHYRLDYPKQDDEKWAGKIITARSIDGKARYEIEDMI
ncbi:MAG: FAD-binding protein [Deltaproteobacteria bacterium]|nr:FAD-binding protein [Deltaproteobacteria bacterium]